MVDWRQGGLTGSIERWVRREVRTQLKESPAARRVRYSWGHRLLRRLLSAGSVTRFVAAYLVVDLAMLGAEALTGWFVPSWIPGWASTAAPGTDAKSMILNVSSYLIGVQVGLLGAVSLALALVTLIAQRESASTDVQVYYHESLAFQIVASCIALLIILCGQLLWPLQFVLHLAGFGTPSQFFKLVLLLFHTGWVLTNLAAVGYFIATTFRFVQQSAREELRKRYTANIVQPSDMTERLRHTLFFLGGSLLEGEAADVDEQDRPAVAFRLDFGEPYEVEIHSDFRKPAVLYDVRMRWVRWVVRRWSRRCLRKQPPANEQAARPLGQHCPTIWFTLELDRRVSGPRGWCRRRGGVPLTPVERFVLARSFLFRRYRNEA